MSWRWLRGGHGGVVVVVVSWLYNGELVEYKGERTPGLPQHRMLFIDVVDQRDGGGWKC